MVALKLYSKPRKRRASPEAELQKAVVQHLRLAGVPGLLFFSVPNEQKCSVQRGVMLKKMGRLAGVSDLVLIIPRELQVPVVRFLELKAKGEKPTEAQYNFGNAVTDARASWGWADDIESASILLTNWGAIKNAPRRRASPFADTSKLSMSETITEKNPGVCTKQNRFENNCGGRG